MEQDTLDEQLALLGKIDGRKNPSRHQLGRWIPRREYDHVGRGGELVEISRRDTEFYVIAPTISDAVSHYIDLDDHVLFNSILFDVEKIEEYLRGKKDGSDVDALNIDFDERFLSLVSSGELPGHADLPWQQYLAMRGYVYLDDACFFIRQSDDIFSEYDPLSERPAMDEGLALLCAAQEFITHARWCSVGAGLVVSPNRIDEAAIIRKAKSQDARRAALKRHEPINQVKEKCRNYYRLQGKASSKAQVVRAFIRTLSDEEVRLFSQDNIQRTLVESLKSL